MPLRLARGRPLPDVGLPASSFALNGAIYGSLLTRYPEIADRVGASSAGFGVVLFAGALGGLLGAVVGPVAVRVLGNRLASVAVGGAFALASLGVAFAPTIALLGLAFLVLGVLDGAHDVSMNALAASTQHRRNRSLMGRVHATWSFALAAATVLGAGAASLRIPVIVHLAAVAAAVLALQLFMFRRSLGRSAGGQPGDRFPGPSPVNMSKEAPKESVKTSEVLLSWNPLLLMLAVAAVAASYVESPGQEWTGLLLNRELGASPGLAAAGPVAFSVGLFVARLFLDTLSDSWGQRRVAVLAGSTVVGSMTAGLLSIAVSSSPWPVLLAIAAAGLGAGPVFPLLFGAADELSARFGFAPALAASVISACSRAGAITAPVVVGFLADSVGLTVVLVIIAVGGGLLVPALFRALPKRGATG